MTTLKTWLGQERGRSSGLAARLGVSIARISQMSNDGVPPKYMLAVRDFTGGAVSLEELVSARTHVKDPKAAKPTRASEDIARVTHPNFAKAIREGANA